jgi:hypothetical protein
MSRKTLLIAGILASLLYTAMLILVAKQWESYSSVSQTVSELSAIGAPTRTMWLWPAAAYTILMTAFGLGVRASDRGDRMLLVTGGFLVAYGLTGVVWPFAPMHLRGAPMTLTDTMHIALSFVTVPLMALAIGVGATALDKRFRIYSLVTLALLIVFGTLTGLNGPRIAQNQPTPWVGVWERVCIGVFLLWVVVLALVLLRANRAGRGARDAGTGSR